MPVDLEAAADNLIQRGWSNDDIKTTFKGVQDHADELIKQGKTNDEIYKILSGTKLKDKYGDTDLFPGPMMKEDWGFATGVRANMESEKQTSEMRNIVQQGFQQFPLKKDPTAVDVSTVQPPTTMQNIASGPVGGAIQTGLQMLATPAQEVAKLAAPLLPFPGLQKLATGQDVSQYARPKLNAKGEVIGEEATGTILDPTPQFAQDVFRGVGEAANKLDKVVENYTTYNPGLGKFLSDAMGASPAFQEYMNKSFVQSVKAARYTPFKSKYAPEVVTELPPNIRNVSPGTESAVGKDVALRASRTTDRAPVNSQAPVSPLTPLESKPSAKLGQTEQVKPQASPLLAETAQKPIEQPPFTNAIQLKDGTIVSDPNAKIHAQVVLNKNIDPNSVASAGYLMPDGSYDIVPTSNWRTGVKAEQNIIKPNEPLKGPIDPVTIEVTKAARDYAIKIGNNDLLAKTDNMLEQAGIPLEARAVTPEQAEYARTTAIDVAGEARRHAENINDPVLLQRSTQIINNNGFIKPDQILNPSPHDLENFTADLNTIVNNKPRLDSKKLEGTAVVNSDGTPKILYHGTPRGFKEYDLEQAQPGMYGVGIYQTDDYTIAGGIPPDLGIPSKFNLSSPQQHFGYANPRRAYQSLDQLNLDLVYTQGKLAKWLEEKAKNEIPGDPTHQYWTPKEIEEGIQYTQNEIKSLQRDIEDYDKNAPNVRPGYANIKNPFDIEKEWDVIDAEIFINKIQDKFPDYDFSYSLEKLMEFETQGNITGQEVYKALQYFGTDAQGNEFGGDRVNKVLQDAGYDGIKHIGGSITGNKPHQVYIAFDPKQVVSKFDPDLYTYRLANTKIETRAKYDTLKETKVVEPSGKPKTVYHGTGKVFEKFDPAFVKPGIRGTEGYWHSESGELVSKSYAKGDAQLEAESAKVGMATARANIEETHQQMLDGRITGEKGLQRLKILEDDIKEFKDIIEESKKHAPNVRPAYLNIKKPFDWEGKTERPDSLRLAESLERYVEDRKDYFEIRWGLVKDSPEFNNKLATHALGQVIDTIQDIKLGRTIENNRFMDFMDSYIKPSEHKRIMQEAGFDGYTHMGGTGRYAAAPDEGPHRVWIAFEPEQVISKFDPRLYSEQVVDIINTEYKIVGTDVIREVKQGDPAIMAKVKQAGEDLEKYRDLNADWLRRNREALGVQQSVVETPPKPNTPEMDEAIGTALVKRATELGVTGSKSGAPTINDIDYREILEHAFGRPRDVPPDFGGFVPPPPDVLSISPPPGSPRGLVWGGKIQAPITVFNKLQAESNIPFLTEMHNTAQIHDAQYTQMELKLEKESNDIVREITGKWGVSYLTPTKKNIALREAATDTLEQIKYYDKGPNIVTWRDARTGVINQTTPEQMAVRLNIPKDQAELAARVRWLYDEYYRRGATSNPNQYLEYYSPHLMNETARLNYIRSLREEDRAFFTYPRTGRLLDLEKDILKNLWSYQREWGRTAHLIPWYNEVAKPVYEAAIEMYKESPRRLETLNYTRNYILDKMRLPRNTAVEANTAMYDFVKNHIEPFSPGTANMIHRYLGTDSLGVGLSHGVNQFYLNYYLRFRPVAAIRNAAQREFALPLLPGGNADLIKAQYQLLRDPAAQEKLIKAGLLPYLDNQVMSTNKWDFYSMAEAGNMGSPFLVVHDGMNKDFLDGMRVPQIREKWRTHLYPSEVEKEGVRLLNNGQIGDIRTLGAIDNAAALFGRYASMMTQFPKGPGEVPEYARTGPVAKTVWLFSTWTPMSIDYFSRLMRQASLGPNKTVDWLRIGKVFAAMWLIDKTWEGLTGKSLQTNLFTNLPTRPAQAPGPTTALTLTQFLTAKWNQVIKGVMQEDDRGFNKWMADKAWKELSRSTPGIVGDINTLGNIFSGPGPKGPKSISPGSARKPNRKVQSIRPRQ